MFLKQCAVRDCSNKNIEILHICVLTKIKYKCFVEFIKSKNKSFKESSKIELILNFKQIPFCHEHYAQQYKLKKVSNGQFLLERCS